MLYICSKRQPGHHYTYRASTHVQQLSDNQQRRRSTQQRRIAAESTEEREARLHQLSVTQRQRIAAESTEEREARLQQLRILPNRNNHQDLLINCHSKYIPILLVLIDVFYYAIIEAFVM